MMYIFTVHHIIIQITIHEGKFFKDQDTFGKQDPFAQFLYDEQVMKTKVIDDGGNLDDTHTGKRDPSQLRMPSTRKSRVTGELNPFKRNK